MTNEWVYVVVSANLEFIVRKSGLPGVFKRRKDAVIFARTVNEERGRGYCRIDKLLVRS